MKKFLDFLTEDLANNYFDEDLLLETRLMTSDFTIGFELECCAKKHSELHDLAYPYFGPDDYNEEDDEEVRYEAVPDLYYIRETLTEDLINGMPKTDIVKDASISDDVSIEPDDKEDLTFEYKSPAVICKPIWIKRFIECLEKWNEEGWLYTNESCGFHTHIKFNGMTKRDIIWIYCNMVCDENFKNKFEFFEGLTPYKNGIRKHKFKFSSVVYSNPEPLLKLRTSLNMVGALDYYYEYDNAFSYRHIENRLRNSIKNLLVTEKMRTFRLHPQGTLEWRGPRNFMNHGNILNIKKYFLNIHEMIKMFREYIDSDVLVGYHTNPEVLEELKKEADFSPQDIESYKNMELKKEDLFGFLYNKNTTNILRYVDLPDESRDRERNIFIRNKEKYLSGGGRPFIESLKTENKDVDRLFKYINNNQNEMFSVSEMWYIVKRSMSSMDDFLACARLFFKYGKKYRNCGRYIKETVFDEVETERLLNGLYRFEDEDTNDDKKKECLIEINKMKSLL